MLPPGVSRYIYRSAYAVSADGIKSETPEPGAVEYRGSKKNNLVNVTPRKRSGFPMAAGRDISRGTRNCRPEPACGCRSAARKPASRSSNRPGSAPAAPARGSSRPVPRRGVAAGALDTVSSGPGGTTGNEQSAGTLRGDRVDRPQGAVRPAVPSFFPRRVRNRRLTLAAPVATCSRSRGGDMRERMPGRTLGAVRKSETGR